MILREGQLEFDFADCVKATRMDGSDSPMPETMRKVDFIIEEQDRVLLVEVKDPSDTHTSQRNREKFIRRLNSGQLINENLVRKCRDTYTYLHLMEKDSKPFTYVVLISLYEHKAKKDLFGPLQDKLRKRLRKEGRQPWKRRYVAACIVVNMAKWNELFPYPAARRELADPGR